MISFGIEHLHTNASDTPLFSILPDIDELQDRENKNKSELMFEGS